MTGEDPTGECVDRVVEASVEARDGWGDNELVVVTTSTVATGKRQQLYKDLQMSAVIEESVPSGAEFRRAGNRKLNVKGLQPEVRGPVVSRPGSNRPGSESERRGGSRGGGSGGGSTFVTGLELEDDMDDEPEFEADGGLVVPGSLLAKVRASQAGASEAGASEGEGWRRRGRQGATKVLQKLAIGEVL